MSFQMSGANSVDSEPKVSIYHPMESHEASDL